VFPTLLSSVAITINIPPPQSPKQLAARVHCTASTISHYNATHVAHTLARLQRSAVLFDFVHHNGYGDDLKMNQRTMAPKQLHHLAQKLLRIGTAVLNKIQQTSVVPEHW
jgi:uncharacterized membrane-anchored protein